MKKKIIMAVPYIFCPEIKHGTRNKSGLAYMIRSIADEISPFFHLYVLTQSYLIHETTDVNGLLFIKRTFFDLLFTKNKWIYMRYAFRSIKKNHLSFKQSLKTIAYYLTGSYLEAQIQSIRPDAVYIHAIGDYTVPYLLACERTRSKILYTLHGLISLNTSCTFVSNFFAHLEQNFIKETSVHNIAGTMISSGMKVRMEKELGCALDNITVVPNFCGKDIETYAESLEDLPPVSSRKNIICVGGLSKRKNQIEVIKAFSLLDENKEYSLRIIGSGKDKDMLMDFVRDNNIKNVVFPGALSHEQLFSEYQSARLVCTASIDEGFGLPILEGYWFGAPSVMFSDIDAYQDLYSEKVSIGVHERSTEALAKGMKESLNNQWDANEIRDFAKGFKSSTICLQYAALLNGDLNCLPNGLIHKLFFDM